MDNFNYDTFGMNLVCNIMREEPDSNLEDLLNKLRDIRIKMLEDADGPEDIHRINKFIAAGVALAKNNSGMLDYDEFNDLLHVLMFRDDEDYIL